MPAAPQHWLFLLLCKELHSQGVLLVSDVSREHQRFQVLLGQHTPAALWTTHKDQKVS